MLDAIDTHVVGAPEVTLMNERVVIAPATGRFHPFPPEVFTSEGEWVRVGTPLAEIHSGSAIVRVESQFEGWVMGMLAIPGQPVTQRDPLFWIRP
jgi:biotin carboxyl carrier protein